MERVYHHKMLDICRSEWSIIPAPDYMHNVHFWSKFFRDPGITQISENHPHLSLVQSHCLHTTYFLILNAYYGRFQGHNGFIHLKENISTLSSVSFTGQHTGVRHQLYIFKVLYHYFRHWETRNHHCNVLVGTQHDRLNCWNK